MRRRGRWGHEEAGVRLGSATPWKAVWMLIAADSDKKTKPETMCPHSSTREFIWKSGIRFFTPRISCTPLVRSDELEISQGGELWPSKLGCRE
ncbi:hypothetical protein B296_00040015 [Ensete ventricosum]|uniref:Uncharacterized protein n=1 Tax=Ensete ventricosum TaxID=4639 RepID=A0A426ZRN1_ENSVE|nr:hypothetical protein B296_00040015 [Ensete ventricosum]